MARGGVEAETEWSKRGQAAAAVATFTHSVLLGLAHISYFSTAANTPHSFEWPS